MGKETARKHPEAKDGEVYWGATLANNNGSDCPFNYKRVGNQAISRSGAVMHMMRPVFVLEQEALARGMVEDKDGFLMPDRKRAKEILEEKNRKAALETRQPKFDN